MLMVNQLIGFGVIAESAGAFPQVVSSQHTATSGADSTGALNGTAIAGELLLGLLSLAENRAITAPSGHSTIYNNSATLDGAIAAFYKVAAGGETSIQATHTSSSSAVWQTYRISGYSGSPSGTFANSTNCPSVTPGGGSKKFLWFVHGSGGNGGSVTTVPSGYGNQLGSGTVGSSARLELETASEDPGSWAISGSNARSATIGIAPA
jgi:hypothetical protein